MRFQVGNQVIEIKFPANGMKMFSAIALIFLAAICLLNSYYTVSEQEEAVITRFGQRIKTSKPGLHFKIPFIDKHYIEKVNQQQKLEFGFGTSHNQALLQKSMVTGDLNAALVEWVVQYRVADAFDYKFKADQPLEALRDASESVMREVVGDRTVDEVITFGRQEIESTCRDKLSELVKLYDLGIVIDLVQLIDVDPPTDVQASFNEVNQAEQEKEQSINRANGQYNRVIPKASGEAEQLISAAEGYATTRINEAEGNVARFKALLKEYEKSPGITKRRIYLETMEKVMPKLGKKVILDSNTNQVLPLLPLDKMGLPSGN